MNLYPAPPMLLVFIGLLTIQWLVILLGIWDKGNPRPRSEKIENSIIASIIAGPTALIIMLIKYMLTGTV